MAAGYYECIPEPGEDMRFSVILPALAALTVLAGGWAANLAVVPAAAQGRADLYTVADIHVDVTAKSSAEASPPPSPRGVPGRSRCFTAA